MDRRDHLGSGEREQVVVAAQVTRMIGEARPPEVGLRELVLLDQRPHGPVEDEDPLVRRCVEKGPALLAGEWLHWPSVVRRAAPARGAEVPD